MVAPREVLAIRDQGPLWVGPGPRRRPLARNERPIPAVLVAMTTLGLIGSGHIGSTVARLAVDAGHDVVLSNSRGPETLQDLADDLGPHARAATTDEAAGRRPRRPHRPAQERRPGAGRPAPRQGRHRHLELLPPARRADRRPRRPVPRRPASWCSPSCPGAASSRASTTSTTSTSARSQRPAGSPERSVLPIAGDDAEAKAAVSRVPRQHRATTPTTPARSRTAGASTSARRRTAGPTTPTPPAPSRRRRTAAARRRPRPCGRRSRPPTR